MKEKISIQYIKSTKNTKEKLVYVSVTDYTSAKWAEIAGVDVAVVGDSLAMTAHGYSNTIAATMDMMILIKVNVKLDRNYRFSNSAKNSDSEFGEL